MGDFDESEVEGSATTAGWIDGLNLGLVQLKIASPGVELSDAVERLAFGFGGKAAGTLEAEAGAHCEVRLVPGAWARFKSGDRDGYLSAISEAAEAAYGDGELWHRISDANGNPTPRRLLVGKELTIPAK